MKNKLSIIFALAASSCLSATAQAANVSLSTALGAPSNTAYGHALFLNRTFDATHLKDAFRLDLRIKPNNGLGITQAVLRDSVVKVSFTHIGAGAPYAECVAVRVSAQEWLDEQFVDNWIDAGNFNRNKAAYYSVVLDSFGKTPLELSSANALKQWRGYCDVNPTGNNITSGVPGFIAGDTISATLLSPKLPGGSITDIATGQF